MGKASINPKSKAPCFSVKPAVGCETTSSVTEDFVVSAKGAVAGTAARGFKDAANVLASFLSLSIEASAAAFALASFTWKAASSFVELDSLSNVSVAKRVRVILKENEDCNNNRSTPDMNSCTSCILSKFVSVTLESCH